MQSDAVRMVPARVLCILVVALGLAVLTGWATQSAVLLSLDPALPTMAANAALALVLAGASLVAWSFGHMPYGRWLGMAVAVIGGLTLLEYLVDVELGIDDALFAPPASDLDDPGRMSPPTAVALLVLGVGLVSGSAVWRGYASIVTGLVALFALYGFLFGVELFYGATPGVSGMAVHTMLALAALSVALGVTVGREYPFDLLYGRGPGQVIARRASLAAIAVPLVMGLIANRAEQAGLWDPALEDAVLALGLSIVLLAVAHTTSRATHQAAGEAVEARDALATANERLEATVERRTAELQEINRELERFVSVVSHDIREPLLVLQMASRRLARDLADAEPAVQRRIQDIHWAVRNATDLVSSMLEWTRNMGQPIHLEETDLEKCLEEALRDLQARIEERKAVIITRPLPRVLGSAGLKQVLQNLIGNAIKYGGDPPRVEVSARPQVGTWRIEVTDNGPGIPKEHQESVFEPFRRLPGNTQEGTGLGLALVRRIVEAHGGKVGIDSPTGQGATVWFTLPRPAAEADA